MSVDEPIDGEPKVVSAPDVDNVPPNVADVVASTAVESGVVGVGVDVSQVIGGGVEERGGLITVYFTADVELMGGARAYLGSCEADELFRDMDSFKKWVDRVVKMKRFDVLVDIRVRDGENPPEVMLVCRDILDKHVDSIDDVGHLAAIAHLGGNKWSRLVALRKLRERAIAGDSCVVGFMQQVVDGQIPDDYMDEDVSSISSAILNALDSGDTEALVGVEELEAKAAIVFLEKFYDEHRAFVEKCRNDGDRIEDVLAFRNANKALMTRMRFMKIAFRSILRGETSVMDDHMVELQGWWTTVREIMSHFDRESKPSGPDPSLEGVDEATRVNMGRILLNSTDLDLRRSVQALGDMFESGLIDLEVSTADAMIILQNLTGGFNHFRYAVSRVAAEKPEDIASFVRDLGFPDDL